MVVYLFSVAFGYIGKEKKLTSLFEFLVNYIRNLKFLPLLIVDEITFGIYGSRVIKFEIEGEVRTTGLPIFSSHPCFPTIFLHVGRRVIGQSNLPNK